MKTIKLTGRYNSFSSAYNKARMYFSMSDDLAPLIKDIYALCHVSGQMAINQSKACRTEISELTVKGKRSTITFEMDVDEASLINLAKYAFDRVVQLTITYDDDQVMPRVNGAFYNKLLKDMTRIASALDMANIEELRVAVNQAYGYSVLINEHMYQHDAEQLHSMLTDFAKESIPDFAIDTQITNDSFAIRRIKDKRCILCDKPLSEIIDGVPLCQDHVLERNGMTMAKFKAKHFL